MPKILIVDDEQNIIELVKFNLTKEGWDVITAYDGRTALMAAMDNRPDLIVLDIMLPEIDGLEVCRILKSREETQSIQIIMLSAKSEELDRIIGLEIGADDYMVKPFSPRELIARIKARLRRKGKNPIDDIVDHQQQIGAGHILMNLVKYEVRVNGIREDFTLKEFELLKLFITNKGRVFTRDFLLERIWGYEYTNDTRTVDVHIRHLRQKIEKDPANPEYIQTIRGLGYRYNDKTDSN